MRTRAKRFLRSWLASLPLGVVMVLLGHSLLTWQGWAILATAALWVLIERRLAVREHREKVGGNCGAD